MLRAVFLLVFTLVLVKLFFPELGGEVERLLMEVIAVVKNRLGAPPV